MPRFQRSWVIGDTLAVAWRNLLALVRVPQNLVFAGVQPVIFVLLFRYVFGNAINVPGFNYVDFLLAGIFVQTMAFGSIGTGIGLAEDMQKGLIERFRTLPMARSAVLGGRALADVARNAFVVVMIIGIGYVVGFRVHTNVLGAIAAVCLLLLFGFAMSWIMALIGLSTGTPESAQAAAFPVMALLVFASNAFVGTATMPRLLRLYAEHQPVTAMANAVRALMLGGETTEPVLGAIAWSLVIIAVFAPLAVMRYRADPK